MATTMLGKDTIRGNFAECYIVIDGVRYNFMQGVDLEIVIEYEQKEINVLGATMKEYHNSMAYGYGKGNFSFNTSIMNKMAEEFKKSGRNTYWDMELTVFDPDSEANGMTCVVRRCLSKNDLLGKFNSNGDISTAKLEFVFSDFEMPLKFTALSGVLS